MATENTSFKSMATWFGTAIIVGVVVVVAMQFASRGQTTGVSGINENLPQVTSEDAQRGNVDSKVVLIEYSDFQCPACASYYPLVERVVDEYKDDILFVYRHFPLPQHLQAKPAAYASEAAAIQGKFWEMYSLIFERQNDWSEKSNADEYFISYAEMIPGLDVEKFKEDFDSALLKSRVQDGYQGGVKAGVNSTPTFYLNGKKLPNPRSYEEFKQAIDDILSDIDA